MINLLQIGLAVIQNLDSGAASVRKELQSWRLGKLQFNFDMCKVKVLVFRLNNNLETI